MCMTCHKLFKRTVGKNQKLDTFIWIMRFIVVFLNVMPTYNMNFVSSSSLLRFLGNERMDGKQDGEEDGLSLVQLLRCH